MRKTCLAVCVALSALASGALAADVDGAMGEGAPARFSSLRNLWAQPPGTMYSLGGYAPAPADGGGCNSKVQLDSPTGCAGIWDGYQARPCGRHRHYANAGGAGGGGCGNTSWGGCGCGRGWGGHGGGWGGGFGGGYAGGYGGGFGGGPIVTGALGCGCGCAPIATGCNSCSTGCNSCGRHHCPLFGHHCRRHCGAGAQASCGCGGDVIDGSPSDGSGPALSPSPTPETVQPVEEPGPSAEKAPRRFRPFTAFRASDKENG